MDVVKKYFIRETGLFAGQNEQTEANKYSTAPFIPIKPGCERGIKKYAGKRKNRLFNFGWMVLHFTVTMDIVCERSTCIIL